MLVSDNPTTLNPSVLLVVSRDYTGLLARAQITPKFLYAGKYITEQQNIIQVAAQYDCVIQISNSVLPIT